MREQFTFAHDHIWIQIIENNNKHNVPIEGLKTTMDVILLNFTLFLIVFQWKKLTQQKICAKVFEMYADAQANKLHVKI